MTAKAFTDSVAETMAARAARPLRRHHVEARAARAHLRRLSPQRPRRDRGRRLFHRARCRGRSVSTPLAWDELSEGIRSDHFTLGNMRHRLDALKDDPWAGFFEVKQRVPAEKKGS